MKIVMANPPRIDEIDAVFGVKGQAVFFSWGDKIYNPSGKPIAPEIMAHEQVHGRRQLNIGVDLWWDRYLTENMFRFEEELIAHGRECAVLAVSHGAGRNARRAALVRTALRFANNKLYRWDPPIPAFKAKQLLLTFIESGAGWVR